jgi:hypothetical protein
MNELYAEAGVKRKETIGTYALRFILIFVAILSFLLASLNTIMLIIGTGLIILIVFMFPRLNVEYEYVFCDGQLDFDKIMGNAKRKTALKIDFEQVEIMAPFGSHELDSYSQGNLTTKDFTSRRKEVKPYVIIYRNGESKLRILFEPNEKMLGCIKMKSPRKLVSY